MDFEDKIEPDQGKFSGLKASLLGLLVLILVLAALAIFYKIKISSPLAKTGSSRIFIVKPGERSRAISSGLYDQGLISSAWIFDFYLATSGQTGNIQAGTYVLSPAMSMREIAAQLVSGRVKSDAAVVQFKEGWEILDIENYLAANNVVSAEDFEKAQKKFAAEGFFGEKLADGTLEGYVFPDTYFVSKNPSADEIINKALANLQKKITPELRAEIAAKHHSVYEVLTLASIVEREVGRHSAKLSAADLEQLDSERRIVAGIFYKRLQLGMPLQSDATIAYVTKNKNVSAADLEINSPYNTYKFAGLPPGPISNPSLSAIEAVINPQQTDYLYFISKPDGTAVFAKTLQEQNANRAKYLQ